MRAVALSFGILGIICIVLGILTAVAVAPAFISSGLAIGEVALTGAFWWGLAGLLLLAAITFGLVSWGSTEG